ncbi:hypothetical protein GobsT_21430 [Gemmata obscuriglobus]|uniref:Uncharacterized protein n=1 Tax=Gemmata obscuriglobus TaxID=114 RepID=A0A2Z3HE00_9BACT|nr:hypothetical protein [Gemmata obscuriglobus]AWM39520.1 hypothetical protein C1280_22680 [Gemmata obscuriglobus]QEG27389.1 hypothetical protein GobsT_21430 [Gemmata obscuriglobus]VTS04293.1 unnamed protein product [Gemmata obscuriglobus UQM 2246]
MPTLEDLLRASLQETEEDVNEASNALHTSAVEIAKATEAVTKNQATVRLKVMTGDETETRYNLDVTRNGAPQGRTVACFGVPKKGFPITQYANWTEDRVTAQFSSKEELAAFFQQLASNPDSPLVGYLSFLLRHPNAGA